jgi:hypothetical protein
VAQPTSKHMAQRDAINVVPLIGTRTVFSPVRETLTAIHKRLRRPPKVFEPWPEDKVPLRKSGTWPEAGTAVRQIHHGPMLYVLNRSMSQECFDADGRDGDDYPMDNDLPQIVSQHT